MTAPSKTSRTTPISGDCMKDGFKSLVAFSLNAGVLLWERDVTPMGRDGGDPIPFDSMHNTLYHMVRPRTLIKGKDLVMRCGYEPRVQVQLDLMQNVEQTITQFFPSTYWVAFYGYLRLIDYQSHKEGDPAEVIITITPTFYDYVNKVEAGPAYGTGT